MKRRIALWLIVLLGAGSVAGCETIYYSNPFDACYHMTQWCSGRSDLQAYSEKDCRDLLPCDICVPDDRKFGEAAAVKRGGTYVVRVSDEWMSEQEGWQGVFAGIDTDIYQGDKAEKVLAEMLHGDAYLRFLAERDSDGEAEAEAYRPWLYDRIDSTDSMNERHIGGAWYVIYRKPALLQMRLNSGQIEWKENQLRVTMGSELNDHSWSLEKTAQNFKGKAQLETTFGTTQVTLFHELGVYICVLRDRGADPDLMYGASLSIDGIPVDTTINGYIDGDDGVFCCTLKDAEAQAVLNGAEVCPEYQYYVGQIDYMNSPYAIVRKNGKGGLGIIDRDGDIVLGLGLNSVSRSGNIFVYDTESGERFAWNADTDETIKLPQPGDAYEFNNAVYATNQAIYDIRTGDKLVQISQLPEGDRPNRLSFCGIDADYVFAQGLPQRIVFGKDKPDDSSLNDYWLADNHGRRISGDYDNLRPLIWRDTRGIFFAQKLPDESYMIGPLNASEFLQPKDEADYDAFNKKWKYMLIDENGNQLTDQEYNYIQVLSADEIEVRPIGGEIQILYTSELIG